MLLLLFWLSRYAHTTSSSTCVAVVYRPAVRGPVRTDELLWHYTTGSCGQSLLERYIHTGRATPGRKYLLSTIYTRVSPALLINTQCTTTWHSCTAPSTYDSMTHISSFLLYIDHSRLLIDNGPSGQHFLVHYRRLPLLHYHDGAHIPLLPLLATVLHQDIARAVSAWLNHPISYLRIVQVS